MNIFPFGDIQQDRFEISKKYGLIECINGVWRLTSKCKQHYDFKSYFRYLKGEIVVPKRLEKEEVIKSLLEL